MTDNKTVQRKKNIRTGRTGDRPYWILLVSIFIRSIHQVGAAVFLTSFLMSDFIILPRLYLIIVAVSGILLMITEFLRHRQLLRELSGIFTVLKLSIFGLVSHTGLPATAAVLFVFILASLCSHAPKNIRHRLLF